MVRQRMQVLPLSLLLLERLLFAATAAAAAAAPCSFIIAATLLLQPHFFSATLFVNLELFLLAHLTNQKSKLERS
jgi:UPF0716 family protein affecting phage T7 exclusion